jgi:PAT family beta-lactamase induction signal transducer AmpG
VNSAESIDMVDIAAPQKKASFLELVMQDPRRLGAAIVLGFSTGLPFILVYSTQSAWLYEAKVPIETIGLLSEMTLA